MADEPQARSIAIPKDAIAKSLIEFLGTGLLCFVIATSTSTTNAMVASLHGLAPFAIGLTSMCTVFLGGHLSGAHYNPAITLATFLRGRMDLSEVPVYWVAQIAGGFAGGGLAKELDGSLYGESIGAPSIIPQIGGRGYAFIAETVLTMSLCFTFLNVATTHRQANNSYAGLAIGWTVLSGVISVGPFSGGVFNPAVGLALPALKQAGEDHIWVYVLAPLLGALLGAGLFVVTHPEELPSDGVVVGFVKEALMAKAWPRLAAPLVTECYGTFMLCFTVAMVGRRSRSYPLAPLAVGSMLMAQVYTSGATSGGLLNPAVTVGVYFRKMLAGRSRDPASIRLHEEFPISKALLYVIFQCLGALLGGAVARWVYSGMEGSNSEGELDGAIGHPSASLRGLSDEAVNRAFLAELVATFMLVTVVLQVTTSAKTIDNHYFGLAIGMTVSAMAIAVGPVSGGAFNPAVGLLCVASPDECPSATWVYFVACPMGGLISAVLFRITNWDEFIEDDSVPGVQTMVDRQTQLHAPDIGRRSYNLLHHDYLDNPRHTGPGGIPPPPKPNGSRRRSLLKRSSLDPESGLLSRPPSFVQSTPQPLGSSASTSSTSMVQVETASAS